MHSIRYSLRQLRRDPVFVAMTVVSLALAVGANTSIFSIVNAMWLRPLPIAQPDRVAVLYDRPAAAAGQLLPSAAWGSARALEDLPSLKGVTYQVFPLTPLGDWMAPRVVLSSGVELETAAVTHNYFHVLGVTVLGQGFSRNEDSDDTGTAILGETLARARFGSAAAAIGQVLSTSAGPLAVAGVTPRNFSGPRLGDRVDIWIPFGAIQRFAKVPPEVSAVLPVTTFVRLADGATWEDVDPRAVARTGPRYHLRPLNDVGSAIRGEATLTHRQQLRSMLWITMLLVLLAGCTNLTASALARAERRRHELTVRVALGATGAALGRLMAAELAVLCLVGLPIAMLVASGLTAALSRYTLPGGIPIAALRPEFDWRVWTFAAIATTLGFIAASIGPMALALRGGTFTRLSSSRGTGTPRATRLRQLLLAVHVALSLVLLTAATSFVRRVVLLTQTDQGLSIERTVFVSVDPSLAEYATQSDDGAGRKVQDYFAYLERLRNLPGVERVTYGSPPYPASGMSHASTLVLDGQAVQGETVLIPAGPDYLAAIGGRLVEGSDIAPVDLAPELNAKGTPSGSGTAAAFPGVLIEASLASRISPAWSPVGRTLQIFGRSYRVAGVFADVLDTLPGRFGAGVVVVAADVSGSMMQQLPDVVIRLSPDTRPMTGVIEKLGQEVFAGRPKVKAIPLRHLLEEMLGGEYIGATLFGWFGTTAVGLAVVGIYGLVAFMAARSRRELAIRLALGAPQARLARALMRTALVPAAGGMAAGVLLSLVTWRALDASIVGLDRIAVSDHATAIATLTAVSVLASALGAAALRKVSVCDVLRTE